MSYVIEGLSPEPFRPFFALDDKALAERLARRVICDASPGYPCRVSLADAELGETLVLVNWQHQPAPCPYRASHAIYVREDATRAARFVGEVPPVLARRTLSLRAYDAEGEMIDAAVLEGNKLDKRVREWFSREGVTELHAHNAAPGCFAARIARLRD